jgi:hypothetical protein
VRQVSSHAAVAAVAMRAFIVPYSASPAVISRRAPQRSERKPAPSWPKAFVTAKALVSSPRTIGGAPSSVAYSGRSGSMTLIPTWLTKPMAASSPSAGSTAPTTRPTREPTARSDTLRW